MEFLLIVLIDGIIYEFVKSCQVLGLLQVIFGLQTGRDVAGLKDVSELVHEVHDTILSRRGIVHDALIRKAIFQGRPPSCWVPLISARLRGGSIFLSRRICSETSSCRSAIFHKLLVSCPFGEFLKGSHKFPVESKVGLFALFKLRCSGEFRGSTHLKSH